MTINQSSQFSDVDNSSFIHAVVSVGTSAVEMKVNGTRLSGRQELRIYNDSNVTIYLGSPSVTTSGATKGEPLVKGQWISYNAGQDVAVYAIAGTTSNNVIVFEKG
jgi:hypothetical protein